MWQINKNLEVIVWFRWVSHVLCFCSPGLWPRMWCVCSGWVWHTYWMSQRETLSCMWTPTQSSTQEMGSRTMAYRPMTRSSSTSVPSLRKQQTSSIRLWHMEKVSCSCFFSFFVNTFVSYQIPTLDLHKLIVKKTFSIHWQDYPKILQKSCLVHLTQILDNSWIMKPAMSLRS